MVAIHDNANEQPQPLIAIDLFAGGGGLSLGLKRAGFSIVAAVELEDSAAKTYLANHPEVKVLTRDIRKVSGTDLVDTENRNRIDLIAGCPPCQGFTSLTAKWHRDDPRNDLISEMGRLVDEIRPKAVMMENVPRLATSGRDRFDAFVNQLRRLGYKVSFSVLQVADYGTPQFRKRLVMLAGLGFTLALPRPTHSRKGGKRKKPWRTVLDTIGSLPAEAPCFVDVKDGIGNTTADWHVVRKMSALNLERLKWARPAGDWRSIPVELRPKCHQGEYFGFRNVYGRMGWNDPSPTITSGCATFSKGRFGHPSANRTITLREAALLQEFPDDYKFSVTKLDEVCDIVGNALPSGFASKVALQVSNTLRRRSRKKIQAFQIDAKKDD